jgi:hypothetical protein
LGDEADRRALSVSVQGCRSEDLDEFQERRHLVLPLFYRRFIEAVGGDPGDFLHGTDIALTKLDAVASAAEHLLVDDEAEPLRPEIFPFCCHEGYQFFTFRLDEGPDPPVFYYMEGDMKHTAVAASFSEWLVTMVRDEFSLDAQSPTVVSNRGS